MKIKWDGARPPSIRDVADRAYVSYQTVSRVLNGHPSVKPATRERVLGAITSTGYRPNRLARALVTRRSRTIGVISAEGDSFGPVMAMQGIEDAARKEGYVVSFAHLSGEGRDTVAEAIDHLMMQAVEGLVVIAPQKSVFAAAQELARGIPLVTLEPTHRSDGHTLAVDQELGGRIATRHLIERGHQRIAHLAGPTSWIEADARVRGFRAELAAAGLADGAVLHGDWSAESGYRVGAAIIRDRSVTAIFAANDQMALGLLHACRDAGVDVPGRLSVIGFDDVPEAAHYSPPLTTVRQDFVELGRRCMFLLLRQINGARESRHEQVPPELVVRDSVAAPCGVAVV